MTTRLFAVSRERRARICDGLAVGLLLALMAALGAVLFFASTPHAKADNDGCAEQFWMWKGLRSATRIICDSPRNPDGSWTRRRGFFADAYTTNGYGSCSRYSCTYYPPRYVPELRVIDEYPVTDATVLPDEPGWIIH